MSFTVIGAAGFVGAHLARHVRSRGSTCHTPARGDEAALFDRSHDHIVYCAGYTSDFLASPADTVEAHVCLLTRLLKHGRFETLTYLSSTRLYDFTDGAGHEWDSFRLNPNHPRHLFDLSKALGESLCVNSGRDGVRAVRLASVYADNLMTDGFLHRVLRAARDGVGTAFDVAPDTARDYIHIDDVVSLLVNVARRGRRPIYNLASGVNVANAELFDAVARLTGTRLTATRPPSGERAAPVIDIDAIREDFAIRPVPLQGRLASVLRVPALGAA